MEKAKQTLTQTIIEFALGAGLVLIGICVTIGALLPSIALIRYIFS